MLFLIRILLHINLIFLSARIIFKYIFIIAKKIHYGIEILKNPIFYYPMRTIELLRGENNFFLICFK